MIENYPEGQVKELEAVNHPEDASMGSRRVPFSRVLYIEQDDFREAPPPKYFRLSPGVEVRLRYAYIIKCTGVTKDPKTGEITEVRCTYDAGSRGGDAKGRKVKGTIHWVSAAHAIDAEVRLYDTLFLKARPDDEDDWKTALNPNSLERISGAKVEPSLRDASPERRYQFERQGYFAADAKESTPEHPVYNKTVGLRDTWAKIEKSG